MLATGTFWHSWSNEALCGLPYMREVSLTEWLPTGWAGTADWIFYDPERRAWLLKDMKTIKGDGIGWIVKDGAKAEHQWQLSAYWHALYDMGLPMVEEFDILYWPKDAGTRSDVPAEPLLQSCAPLPRDVVHGLMAERWEATSAYLDLLHNTRWNTSGSINYSQSSVFLNEYLAPVQERVQKITWVKTTKTFDLKLAPHWSASYCPFPSELCDCREQGTTKVGHWTLDGVYEARKGWEQILPDASPTTYDFNKRRKEHGF